MAIYGIVEAIAIAVRPDALFRNLEPVGLQEQAELGVVVAGVQVLKPCVLVVTLADPAFCLGQGLGGRKPGRFRSPGVCPRFYTRTPPTLSATRTDPSASVKT